VGGRGGGYLECIGTKFWGYVEATVELLGVQEYVSFKEVPVERSGTGRRRGEGGTKHGGWEAGGWEVLACPSEP
jgi:hypothetical protein